MSQPAKPQPKDLTATLLKNNLDELNLSMSRSTLSQPDYTAKNSTGLSWNKNNNVNQAQFLTSPTLSSQTMPTSRPMNWNSNGIGAPMNWNADQSATMWGPVAPQNNAAVYSQWEGQAKFAAQPEIKSNMNFPGTLQPFMTPTSTQTNTSKPNTSTQDIMDLLS